MNRKIIEHVVQLAHDAHQRIWRPGKSVGTQTRRSNEVCRAWQKAVEKDFSGRFKPEHQLNEKGRSHQIDLVDLQDRVAYELKSSPNNVHMEVYRDVFKVLVFNLRNPALRVKMLVFIAPKKGIEKLGEAFSRDVATIARKLDLEVKLEGI